MINTAPYPMVRLLLGMLFAPVAQAAPALHLLFHMGAGANGEFFVGGTLENKGDEAVYRGFVVVTPLTRDCFPQAPLLWKFGEIKVDEQYEFRVPIEGRLYGYKLDTVHAVDSFANPVTVVDDTAEVVANKQQAYMARCKLAREVEASAPAK